MKKKIRSVDIIFFNEAGFGWTLDEQTIRNIKDLALKDDILHEYLDEIASSTIHEEIILKE